MVGPTVACLIALVAVEAAPALRAGPPLAAREDVAVNLRLVPLDGDSTRSVHGLSFGLLGDHVGQVTGLELTSIAETGSLTGAQLALAFNFVDGEARGLQMAGLANFAGGVRGVQVAIASNVAEQTRGVQLGLFNSAGDGWGFQLGLSNAARRFVGARLGLANGAEELRGAEVGLINAGGSVAGLRIGLLNVPCIPTGGACVDTPYQTHGADVALVNVTEAVVGVQLGGVNLASRVKGWQVGLINLAAHAQGETLGLLNIVGDGQHHVALYATDTMLSNVAVKLGARHLYTAFVAGYQPGDQAANGEVYTQGSERVGLGLGLGWRAPIEVGRLAAVEVEASAMEVRSTLGLGRLLGQPLLTSLHVVADVRLFRHVDLVAGVAANLAFAADGRDLDAGLPGGVWRAGGTTVRLAPGLIAGLQL